MSRKRTDPAKRSAAKPKLPHTSKHMVNGKIVEVPRRWDDVHLKSNYDLLILGEHSHPKHPLHGQHGHVTVEHVEGEPRYEDGRLVEGSPTVGPEFKLSWPNGSSVTVPCADAVKEYLAHEGVSA